MRPAVVLARLIVVAAVLLAPGVARAQAASERRCQRAIAFAGAQIFKRSLAILASCEHAVARATLPANTECASATSQARRAAAARFERLVAVQCADGGAATTLALGGECTGARGASVVTCLRGSHLAASEWVVAVSDAPGRALSAPAARCQWGAAAAVRSFTLARLRAVQQCKLDPPATLPPGTSCDAEPLAAARIAGWRSAASARIAAACPAAVLAETRFGAPCAAPSSAATLAHCLLDAAQAAGDRMTAAQFPDPGFCGDAPAIEAQIDALLAQMTFEEKIASMHGGMLRGGWRTNGVERLGLPGMSMIDGPRGVSALIGNATAFPVGIARGATWDTALEERVGGAIGREARAKTNSVVLAPVLNILRHPRWGRAQETYGEDTFHLGSMGVAFIRGAQRYVAASAKHFAANSIEDTRFVVDVLIDERTLREIYLPHFRRAVQDAHAVSVMTAYNQVNGQYCAENFHLVHDILKGEWGFQGFVESDWLLGTRSTVPSALAGLDIEMPAPRFYGQPLAEAVAAGAVPLATIDAAVRRIVRAQLCLRLADDPPQADPSQIETPEHRALALEVAREAIVLLKNAPGALPLDRAGVGSIAVVGGLAAMANLGDHGSSWVTPASSVSPLDGLRARAGSVTVTHFSSLPLSDSDRAAIAQADAAVVVAGLTFAEEGESAVGAGDRDSLALPPEQDALIAAVAAANPRTIVVLEGSGAFIMPWIDDVAAIVMAWYPGQEGGNAIADVLFGAVSPSGKLPMSFPRAEQDLPPFDNQSSAVTYDYFHGYRHLDRAGVEPLFPFGFGLSYTTFEYSNLTVAPAAPSVDGHVRVTADITNAGGMAGDEIAQLYVGYQGSSVERAPSDLEGFVRVYLEPGQTTTVAFDLRVADLAYWDAAAAGWKVEPITYTVHVGRSSRDLPLAGSFAVRGADLQ